MRLKQDRLKRLLHYFPEEGKFYWLVNKSSAKMFDEAGSLQKDGYIIIGIDKKSYLAHRLAFLFMTGEVPEYVDHINGDRSDNRWENLRPCSLSENNRNRKITNKNTSGVKGVSWHKASGKWQVQLSVKGNNHFGLYSSLEEAEKRAIEVRKIFHKAFARNE